MVRMLIGRPWVWLLACFCFCGCDLAFHREFVASTERTGSIAYRADAPVVVQSRNGRVRVTSGGVIDAVEVDAILRCGGIDQEEADERASLCQLTIDYLDDGALRIQPAFPDQLRNGDGADLEVRVPPGCSVQVTSANGLIEAIAEDDNSFRDLTATTSNAPIHANSVIGNVTLTSSNGKIKARRVGGVVTARTSNAPIEVEDVEQGLTLTTDNGAIRLTLVDAQSGPITAATSNAPIVARVGNGFAGRVTLDTSNARVVAEDESGNRFTENKLKKTGGYVVVGKEGETSRLKTSNGKIEFRVAP